MAELDKALSRLRSLDIDTLLDNGSTPTSRLVEDVRLVLGAVNVSRGEAIVREREDLYGSPVPNMERFAKLIEGVLGCECSPLQATLIMVQLKIVREAHGGHLDDNLDDIEGYVAIARRVVSEE